jgi:hypothetical protein
MFSRLGEAGTTYHTEPKLTFNKQFMISPELVWHYSLCALKHQ